MPKSKNQISVEQKSAFIQGHRELFEMAYLEKHFKLHKKRNHAKGHRPNFYKFIELARVHFNYSPKTVSSDIWMRMVDAADNSFILGILDRYKKKRKEDPSVQRALGYNVDEHIKKLQTRYLC